MGTIVAPMLCRPYGAYIWGVCPRTGVDTPAYALAPYGLINSILCLIHSLRV